MHSFLHEKTIIQSNREPKSNHRHRHMTTKFSPDYSHAIDQLATSQLADQDYATLLEQSKSIALALAVPQSLQETVFRLLAQLHQHDQKTAKECLQALPLALKVAQIYSQFYSQPVNLGYVWSAAILHDIGKTHIPQSLITKSNRGLEWTDADREQMMYHVQAGYTIARAHHLPTPVCRAIAEHHHKQLGVSYGMDPQLNDIERIIRDSIAIADFTDADLNRTNCRNATKNRQQRLAEIIDDIIFVFNDYTYGNLLAQLTFQQLAQPAYAIR